MAICEVEPADKLSAMLACNAFKAVPLKNCSALKHKEGKKAIRYINLFILPLLWRGQRKLSVTITIRSSSADTEFTFFIIPKRLADP